MLPITQQQTPPQMTPRQGFLMHQGASSTPMIELVQDYQSGRLQIPPHQRGSVWTIDKVVSWVETMYFACTAGGYTQQIGTFVSYQIIGDGSYWLNDGWQRLQATMRFLKEAETPNESVIIHRADPRVREYLTTADPLYPNVQAIDKAWEIIRYYLVTRQHVHYEDHVQALYWFQKLQEGTPLTNYEYCKGVLMYLQPHTNWEGWLTANLHVPMSRVTKLLPIKTSTKQAKVANEIVLRHNLALLYMWISEQKTLERPYSDVAKTVIDLEASRQRTMVEQVLGRLLIDLGFTLVEEDVVKNLLPFLQTETLVIRETWQTTMHYLGRDQESEIGFVLFRWLLLVAIWRKNAGIKNNDGWRLFLAKLFYLVDKRGQVATEQDKTIIFQMDNLATLPRLLLFLDRIRQENEPRLELTQYIIDNDLASKKRKIRKTNEHAGI